MQTTKVEDKKLASPKREIMKIEVDLSKEGAIDDEEDQESALIRVEFTGDGAVLSNNNPPEDQAMEVLEELSQRNLSYISYTTLTENWTFQNDAKAPIYLRWEIKT